MLTYADVRYGEHDSTTAATEMLPDAAAAAAGAAEAVMLVNEFLVARIGGRPHHVLLRRSARRQGHPRLLPAAEVMPAILALHIVLHGLDPQSRACLCPFPCAPFSIVVVYSCKS